MTDTRPCPFCAEPINVAATKCRYCGEFLDERRTHLTPSPHRGAGGAGGTTSSGPEVIYHGPMQAAAALLGPFLRLLIVLAIAGIAISVGRNAPATEPIRAKLDQALEDLDPDLAKLSADERRALEAPINRWLVYGGIGLGALALLLFARRFLVWMTSRLRITEDRLEYERGILSKDIKNVELHRIQDIYFRRGFIDLFLGLGRIRIISTDKAEPILAIGPLFGARRLYDRLKAVQTAAKDRRGVVHVEG